MAGTLLIPNMDAGFFANFNCVLNNLDLGLERTGTTAARVEWKRRQGHFTYGEAGENVWDRYFEPLAFPDFPQPVVRAHNDYLAFPLGGQWMYHTYKFVPGWRERFNAVYRRHIRIRSHIRAAADLLRETQFGTRRVLGVHGRGTAISPENMFAVPPPDYWIARTRQAMDDLHAEAVFLASDSAVLTAAFRTAFGSRLIEQPAVTRGGHMGEVHRNAQQGGPDLGEQVLIDCLLLASCVGLLHVTSNVATAAGLMNPAMPMIYCETPLRAAIATRYTALFGRRGISVWSGIRGLPVRLEEARERRKRRRR